MHCNTMKSIRDNRTSVRLVGGQVKELKADFIRMEAKLDEVLDSLRAEVVARQAAASWKVDADMLGLPWSDINEVKLICSDKENIDAIRRLLRGPFVPQVERPYLTAVIEKFFHSSLRGFLSMSTLSG